MLAVDVAIAAAASNAANTIFLVDTKPPFFLFFSYRVFLSRGNDTGPVKGNLGNSARRKPANAGAREKKGRPRGRPSPIVVLLLSDQKRQRAPMLRFTNFLSGQSELIDETDA